MKTRAWYKGYEAGYRAATKDAAAKLASLEPDRQALRESIARAERVLRDHDTALLRPEPHCTCSHDADRTYTVLDQACPLHGHDACDPHHNQYCSPACLRTNRHVPWARSRLANEAEQR